MKLKSKTTNNLSIIIPVYNTEKYIEKCLNSVLKNVPENTEVLVINDGSPDNSEYIIKKFEKRYPNVLKYYKKENGGLSDTKNYGIAKATGKYITFVDSDDYVDSNMHKEMLALALKENADVVYCDVEQVFDDGHTIYNHCTNIKRTNDFFRLIDTPLMATSCNKLVKKELYEGAKFPVGLNNEDVAITPILVAQAKKICKIDKPFYKYYQRAGSIQNNTFNEKRFVIFDTAKICFEYAKTLPEEVQLQIKTSLYTHQILALLIYPISDLSKKEQEHLIPIFCKKINTMFGEDLYQNTYVKDFLKDLHRKHLLGLIKQENTKAIIKWLSYYKHYDKISAFFEKAKNSVKNFFISIKNKLVWCVKKLISLPRILIRKTKTFFRLYLKKEKS